LGCRNLKEVHARGRGYYLGNGAGWRGLLRTFEQTRVAYFEAEPAGDDEWKIVRRVPDHDW